MLIRNVSHGSLWNLISLPASSVTSEPSEAPSKWQLLEGLLTFISRSGLRELCSRRFFQPQLQCRPVIRGLRMVGDGWSHKGRVADDELMMKVSPLRGKLLYSSSQQKHTHIHTVYLTCHTSHFPSTKELWEVCRLICKTYTYI